MASAGNINASSCIFAQTRHARKAALQILEQPKDYVHIFGRMLGAQVLSCVYGYEVTPPDDEMIKLAEGAAQHLGQAILPFNFLANVFPWLKWLPSWLPGMGWKNLAKEWGKELTRTVELPYEYTMRQIAAPSALSEILASLHAQPEDLTEKLKDRVMWTAGSAHTAAVESLHATLQVFILVMTLYPEFQARMQDEIDQATQGKRLPELSDMGHMPYVRCVILEMFRWLPAGPLGVPHICEEEDGYNGYTIPKGSIVVGNMWAINQDESRYNNPDTFIPERFMDPNTPEPAVFGFGRRLCPGMHFANSALFINIATILAICNIRPGRDEDGKDVDPAIEMVQGALAMTPAPFECIITPL